jgi:hypothetical protein
MFENDQIAFNKFLPIRGCPVRTTNGPIFPGDRVRRNQLNLAFVYPQLRGKSGSG